jgi:hypothetical protein
MVLPKATEVSLAADDAILSSHPAWLSIESPMLIMLGCSLIFLAVWARKALRKYYTMPIHQWPIFPTRRGRLNLGVA